jgi:hypothetical protein
MPNKLSKDVIAHWPEVFKDIDVKTVPIEYLQSITIYFRDGRKWVVNVDKKAKANPELNYGIDNLLKEYENAIVNIDFRLNTAKVRKDIESRTKTFLKKRK